MQSADPVSPARDAGVGYLDALGRVRGDLVGHDRMAMCQCEGHQVVVGDLEEAVHGPGLVALAGGPCADLAEDLQHRR